MSSLVVGGVPIRVAPSSPKTDTLESVDRTSAFNNTYRVSITGGTREDFHFSTPPVSATLFASYMAVLSNPVAQMCSGDILSIPTMCCPEVIGWTPVSSQGVPVYVIDFVLHEQQAANVLLRYSPGDTITGESFTRSTTGPYINSTAGINTASINAKRDAHFPKGIGSVQSLLLEDARTNVNTSALSAWTSDGASITTGQADPAGGTVAVKITQTGGNSRILGPNAAFTGDGVKALQFGVLGGTSAASTILLRDTTASAVRVQVTVTWTAGVPSLSIVAGAGTLFPVVALSGGYYVIAFAANGVVAANANRVEISPDNSNTGKFITAYRPNIENASFPSSFLDASVTRGADSYSLPYTAPPSETSVYVKFVEGGTLLASGAVVNLSALVNANPQFLLWAQGGFYQSRHHNGTTSVASTLAVAPAFGDTVELLARLFGDGSVDVTQSINGAASTSATQSAALALPAAWSGQLAILNAAGGGSVGFIALQSLKIVAGARSLSEMRAL